MLQSLLIDSLDGIAYLVDLEGRIVSYGQKRWNISADANGAPELSRAENVLGRRLLDIVQGDDVRRAYRSLMDELLTGERDGFGFSLRCDAPEEVRFMRMGITPVKANGDVMALLFQCITLHREMRPPLDIFRFRDLTALLAGMEDRPVVRLCSYCQKVMAPPEIGGTDDWILAEDYYRLGGRSDVQISHGLCPDCRVTFWRR